MASAHPDAKLLAAAREGRFADAAALAQALAAVDPFAIAGDEARLAFWINLYNARVLHEFGERPRQGSLVRHQRLFNRVGYRVGEHVYSLNAIEHGVLRLNAKPPYALRRPFRSGDPRSGVAPSRLDPRIHFALNCAAASCPPVRAYRAEEADTELRDATRAYIAPEVRIDAESGHVTLPYLMKLYRLDFGSQADALDFAAAHLSESGAASLRAATDAGAQVRYGNYDWTIP